MMKLTTKKPLRFLAALMVVVLLVTCIPLNVFGANEELLPFDTQTTENTVGGASGISENDNVSVIDGNVIGEYVEDISKREENVKHFANPDGTYTAIVYPTAVHRKDADGVWQDINNDLALTTVKGGEKYASADSRVSFASRFAPSAELMTLSENGYSISMSLISDSKNDLTLNTENQTFSLASVTNAAKKELPKTDVKLEDVARVDNRSSIVYNNIRANTDIEYILDGNDVKENIIVKAPLSSYEYAFDLRLDGLVAILNENGSIVIYDAETEEAKYQIPAPYMYDASGAVSYAVEYTLIAVSSGRYLLMVTADKSWINADGREFPVTIDPSIEEIDYKILSSDTYISQSSPDSNYCGAQVLPISDATTALIFPFFPVLGEYSVFLQAQLFFSYYFDSNFPEVTTIGVYQITSNWSETETTYSNRPNIATEPIDTVSLAVDEVFIDGFGWECFDITEVVSEWYSDNNASNGVAIKMESGIFDVNINSYDSGINTCEFLVIKYTAAFDEGVYAFEKVGVENHWLTVSENMIQHKYLSQNPTVLFETDTSESVRASLFKISKKNEIGHYVIRSMIDNKKGLGVENGLLVLKDLPYSDADVSYGDVFNVYEAGGSFVFRHVSSGMFITMEFEEMSTLTLTHQSVYTNDIKWFYDDYSGVQSGFDIGTEDNFIVRKEVTLFPKCWSTQIGYNEPFLCNSATHTNSTIQIVWNNTDKSAKIIPKITGAVDLTWSIYDEGAQSTMLWGNITIQVDPPLLDGEYYIANMQYLKYLSADSGENMNGIHLSNETPQKWYIEHTSNGCYTIHSVETQKGLVLNGVMVEQETATSDSWRITEVANGSYLLEYGSSPEDGSYVFVEYTSGFKWDSYPIVHEPYTFSDQSNKWYFFRTIENDIVLVGVENTGYNYQTGANTSTVFDNDKSFIGIMSQYTQNQDTGFTVIQSHHISKQEYKNKMENSRIFVSRSHGGYVDGKLSLLLDQSNPNYLLKSEEIYNFNTKVAGFDLSNCELIIFVACHAGEDTIDSFAAAAVAAGAECAIAFKGAINEDQSYLWTNDFFKYYSQIPSVDYALYKMYDDDGIPLGQYTNIPLASVSIQRG